MHNKYKFNYGCISYTAPNNTWNFSWYENKKHKSKSFSCNKYNNAKQLAEEFRIKVYPDYKSKDEPEIINDIEPINNLNI